MSRQCLTFPFFNLHGAHKTGLIMEWGKKEEVKSNIKYHLSVKVLLTIKDYQEQIMKIC